MGCGEATKFLVGDPKNGVPLRNPMPHEIAERLRSSPLWRTPVLTPEKIEELRGCWRRRRRGRGRTTLLTTTIVASNGFEIWVRRGGR